MSTGWSEGNAFELLENGEEFFPRVFEAIGAARREVLVETFILFEDKVGLALQEALVGAARRGVQVSICVDGFGAHELTEGFIGAFAEAGVTLTMFDPQPKLFGWRYKVFRRMHRKIVVIDGEHAFVGGINYSADHLADFGPEAKQDYAVAVEGPIVAEIHRFVLDQFALAKQPKRWFQRRSRPVEAPETALAAAGKARALFVVRDNNRHRTAIERHYRSEIRAARERIVIANAYFFPGYRLLREMRRAARRGVDVRLILQGEPDMPIVKTGAELLYEDLLKSGVRIFEYCKRPLHGKVALVDDEWSTVGSSNLDPLSLALNLEANVMIRDRDFNAGLMDRLGQLMEESCTEVTVDKLGPKRYWSKLRSFVLYHVLRLYPRWGALLPDQEPHVVVVAGGPPGSTA
ncbi:MAG: cardiolipin synthase ClsB [Burkholderiaceae bacterium]